MHPGHVTEFCKLVCILLVLTKVSHACGWHFLPAYWAGCAKLKFMVDIITFGMTWNHSDWLHIYKNLYATLLGLGITCPVGWLGAWGLGNSNWRRLASAWEGCHWCDTILPIVLSLSTTQPSRKDFQWIWSHWILPQYLWTWTGHFPYDSSLKILEEPLQACMWGLDPCTETHHRFPAARSTLTPCSVCGRIWESLLSMASWPHPFLLPMHPHSASCCSRGHVGRTWRLYNAIHNRVHNWKSGAGNLAAFKPFCKPCPVCSPTIASQHTEEYLSGTWSEFKASTT